jgi:hypothetical protein
MSHGYAGEGEQFWRGWDIGDVPADFSFLVALKDESGELPIVNRFGIDIACKIGDALRASPEQRQKLALQMRQDYWWIRNHRWATGEANYEQKVYAVLDAVCMLELGGVPPRDLVMMCQCFKAACVCMGCDCANGTRVLKTA